MNNEEYLNKLIIELSVSGVKFDPANSQSLKEVLKKVSNDKNLYKKVCKAKKCYQRLQQNKQQGDEPSVSTKPLTDRLNYIFNQWERYEI